LDRDELTLAVAGALFAAVLLGCLIGAIAGRLNARGPRGAARRDLLARIDAAEAARRAAEVRLAAVETDLGLRLGEAEAELRAAHAALDRERASAEELRAAWRAATSE
jgi:hypothetical protein